MSSLVRMPVYSPGVVERAREPVESPERPSVVESLRGRIARMGGAPRGGVWSRGGRGVEGVEGLVRLGLLPGCCLEFRAGEGGGGLSLVQHVAGRCSREGAVLWVDVRGEFHAPSFVAAGGDLSRLLWVRPGGMEEGLRALSILVGSGAFRSAVVDVPSGWAPGRGWVGEAGRLLAVARRGGASLLWLGPGQGGAWPVPVDARVEVTGGPGGSVRWRLAGGRGGAGGGGELGCEDRVALVHLRGGEALWRERVREVQSRPRSRARGTDGRGGVRGGGGEECGQRRGMAPPAHEERA